MTDALLLDISGVLYDGDVVIPGALAALKRVRDSRLKVRFITNTSQKSRDGLLRHLRTLGFELEEDELFTAVDAARQWLRQRQLRPWCLIHEDIASEFTDFDQRDPNAVFIGDAAEGFNYRNLNRAFQLCMEGAPLLGVGDNRYFKSGSELLLDVGAFIKAIEYAAGIEATIVGKPSAEFFRQVLASTEALPARTLMVGDDVFGDVAGALNAGIRACLVRTGKYREGDENRVDGNFQLVDSVVQAVGLALDGQP